MRAFLHRPCSPLSLGAVVVLLAGVLVAPTPARAGCGDHAVVVSSAKTAPMPPIMPVKKQAPCSGPHCTRSPVAPAPVPSAPAPPSGQEWACVLEPLLLSTNNSWPYPPNNSCEHPHFIASSVYHPPR